jgi:hypothetical protein
VNLVVEFSSFKVQDKLPGERLEARAVALDDDVATIGDDAQLRERGLDL